MRYAPIRARFCSAAWFPFCMGHYSEKQQNMLLIYFIERIKISTEWVHNILVP